MPLVEHDSENCQTSTSALAPAHPADSHVSGRADAVDQLRAMMLDVADIDELVLLLGQAIPTEATLSAIEIQRVHGVIDHAIAEFPVLEHVRLRVRLTPNAVALPAMLFPQPKRSFVALKIGVQRTTRDTTPARTHSCGR